MSTLLGWLLVAVPLAAVLLIGAWGMAARFGGSSGVFYAIALVVWGGLLIWRWARSR